MQLNSRIDSHQPRVTMTFVSMKGLRDDSPRESSSSSLSSSSSSVSFHQFHSFPYGIDHHAGLRLSDNEGEMRKIEFYFFPRALRDGAPPLSSPPPSPPPKTQNKYVGGFADPISYGNATGNPGSPAGSHNSHSRDARSRASRSMRRVQAIGQRRPFMLRDSCPLSSRRFSAQLLTLGWKPSPGTPAVKSSRKAR